MNKGLTRRHERHGRRGGGGFRQQTPKRHALAHTVKQHRRVNRNVVPVYASRRTLKKRDGGGDRTDKMTNLLHECIKKCNFQIKQKFLETKVP